MSDQHEDQNQKQSARADDAFDRARMTNGEAHTRADDVLVDALLDAHLSPSERDARASAMEARISRAFTMLDAERANATSSSAPIPFAAHGPSTRPTQFARQTWSADRRTVLRLARAALIALAFGAMFLLFPYETSASTLLDRALTAETSPLSVKGSRRYEVRVVLPPREGSDRGPNAPTELAGTWDLRGDEARLDLSAGGARSTTRASSANGAWERSIDGTVRALDSRELWP
ncbi:MAG: hypothetical protein RL591_2655, partial [Planctomycetota bacterium]